MDRFQLCENRNSISEWYQEIRTPMQSTFDHHLTGFFSYNGASKKTKKCRSEKGPLSFTQKVDSFPLADCCRHATSGRLGGNQLEQQISAWNGNAFSPRIQKRYRSTLGIQSNDLTFAWERIRNLSSSGDLRYQYIVSQYCHPQFESYKNYILQQFSQRYEWNLKQKIWHLEQFINDNTTRSIYYSHCQFCLYNLNWNQRIVQQSPLQIVSKIWRYVRPL